MADEALLLEDGDQHGVRRRAVGPDGSSPGAGIEFSGLSCTIGAHRVLQDATGTCPAGRLTAILGPSGAGKSTLLDILAGRKTVGTVTGSILAHGDPVGPGTASALSYIVQEETLLPRFTVAETLDFAARLRLGPTGCGVRMRGRDSDAAARDARVRSVIRALGLEHRADTAVGAPHSHVRGVSGGERRRVSIGVELLTDPDFLLADEPTSGLDSSAALGVVRLLKDEARRGRVVVATLHQPRPLVWELVDNVILMAAGRVVYAGPRDGCADHFAAVLGNPVPRGWNPADFFLDVVVASAGSPAVKGGGAEGGGAGVPAGVPAAAALAGADLGASSVNPSPGGTAVAAARIDLRWARGRRCARGLAVQVAELLVRNTKFQVREPTLLGSQVAGYIFTALLVGLLFTNLKSNVLNQLSLGLSFTCDAVGVLSFFALPSQLAWRPAFNHERAAGFYSTAALFIALSLHDAVVGSALSLVYSSILWKMMRLKCSFAPYVCIHLIFAQGQLALNSFLGSVFRTTEVAIAAGGCINVSSMMLSGVLISYANMPPYLKWAYWTTPYTYAEGGLFGIEYPHHPGGEQFLDLLDVRVRDPWMAVLILAAFYVGFRIAHLAALAFMHREKR